MTLVTPEKRAHLQSIARLGGLTTAAKIDTHLRAQIGQNAFRAAFKNGHSCKLCPLIQIPEDLPEAERARRADLLFTLHFGRLARARR